MKGERQGARGSGGITKREGSELLLPQKKLDEKHLKSMAVLG